MEQLHSVTVSGALGAVRRTAPQWQAASIIGVLRTRPMGDEPGDAVQPRYLWTPRGFLQHRRKTHHRLAAGGDDAAQEHHAAAGLHHLARAFHQVADPGGADELAVEGGGDAADAIDGVTGDPEQAE